MAGDPEHRAWKERGSGNFKLNLTVDEPKKARFVLRADGTHRLLLNVAVTKTMVFGGDATGAKPKDMRLLFNSPTPEGELEMHLLKVRHDTTLYLCSAYANIPVVESRKRHQAVGGSHQGTRTGIVELFQS